MDGTIMVSEQLLAARLMILSGLIFLVGGLMYTTRAIWKRPRAQTLGYLRLERMVIVAALLLLVVGLAVLERRIEAAGVILPARIGMVALLVGAAAVIPAEGIFMSRRLWLYRPIVVYIVLAFVAQGIFGMALLQSQLLPAWIGWATVLWNMDWLVVLPIARPRDLYYPWLHHAAPLMIGIALLSRIGG